MDTSNLSWHHTGRVAVLADNTTGEVRGTVQTHLVPTLWMGTAILGPETVRFPIRPLHKGERVGANLTDPFPVTGGRCQLCSTQEAAMKFVIETLNQYEPNQEKTP